MKVTPRNVILTTLLVLLFAALSGIGSALDDAALKKYAFPDSEDGLPGAGALRRYEGYVKRWPEFRAKWASEVEADQKAVVFLGDSITQGWGTSLPKRFPGMKLANRGIGGDTTRGMLKNYQAQDWNELVVRVEGGNARATCNGELLEEAMEVPETGPIGHEGDRGQMEYRRIRLKKID